MTDFRGAFSGRRVLVTGHTGFKGAWLSLWLRELGAEVVGFSLPPSAPSLFESTGLARLIDSRLGDLRDRDVVHTLLAAAKPELVFHLAAQPLVRRSYEDPAETWSTNVLGLVHLLDAVRAQSSVRACQVITSDKCYDNKETGRAHRENDPLGGRDPYSASKACAEIVAASYRDSFFKDGVSLATARAGNVIGGGDWAKDRIVPDCVRALAADKPITVRNPDSIRPWQHVLEPLSGYLALAAQQLREPQKAAQAFNFGPADSDSVPVRHVVELAIKHWGSGSWVHTPAPGAHEANVLRLDCSKARAELDWTPAYGVDKAMQETVAWYKQADTRHFDALAFSLAQIAAYSGQREAKV